VPNAGFAGAPAAHHGAVFADFDGDGLIDIAVSVLNGPAEVWRNVSPVTGNWMALVLKGKRSNRDGIGARVEVDGKWNHLSSSVSYASSVVAPLHFGLGNAKAAKEVRIHWPSGTVQTLENLAANQIHIVEESAPSNE
jgi:hypothetical protein